jgi:hypothetical protein
LRRIRNGTEGGGVLLEPVGSPIPDDAVTALRGQAGALGNLSVPLSWGVAVPADPEPVESARADIEVVPGALTDISSAETAGTEEWDEWAECEECDAESTEPRFEMLRNARVIPRSPAAG